MLFGVCRRGQGVEDSALGVDEFIQGGSWDVDECGLKVFVE